jgi:hypothetical protein
MMKRNVPHGGTALAVVAVIVFSKWVMSVMSSTWSTIPAVLAKIMV